MDSFISMGGYQMPFQRRLSRLYNDTKKSSDFVKEPVQNAEDPEIKALHRKLRIQKDRLITWGVEWSDPSQSAEVLIDSSLSKAGLSEVVGSIMSTIKDILAEAEPLWHSSRKLAGSEKGYESEKGRSSRDQKMPLLAVWDKSRFEDLVRDLTSSIDTLYDLSRTRSSYAQSPEAARQRLYKSTSSTEELRPFESSRMETPQQIDPKGLTYLSSMQAVPMTKGSQADRQRDIVFMDKQAYSELTQQSSSGRQANAPLLLEYADFDPIFSATGIPPPLDRFEKLWAGLQTNTQRSPGSWSGLPRLLGHFEDTENSRYGLVYQFPATFNPVTFEHLTQNPLYNLCSLADLLARPDFEPKLEAKFRLAANLANTVFDLHAQGITHGNLTNKNVSFCNAVGTDPGVSGMSTGEVDLRRPLISSFDLFSGAIQQGDQPSSTTMSLYKHPLDPRTIAQSPLANIADSKTFDLYSLSMLLLSIGLWTKLENLAPAGSMPVISEALLEQLAIRCGTLYMKAVQTCWNAVDQEMAGQYSSDQVVARVQLKASRYLEACCILDGVSNLEERLSDDLGETRTPPAHLSTSSSFAPEPSKQSKAESSQGPPAPPPAAARQGQGQGQEQEQEQASMASSAPVDISTASYAETKLAAPSAKMCLFPQVPLPPDTVETWNTVVMPQINVALRHFYRKHPESVEISLESIGETPQPAQPTVLVVCTSVNKVRAILKKQLGMLFDGTTGFGLKVCRGSVLRSRNRGINRSKGKGSSSSSSNSNGISAANPDYQERPLNGASIGAWIGDRHLPPVSFGGLIMVDDKPYGMTVHHMLDDPDQDHHAGAGQEEIARSMARGDAVGDLAAWYAEQHQTTDDGAESSGTEDFSCEFSDTDSEAEEAYSESDITSESSDFEDEADDSQGEPGDIPGIEPGCGEGYMVTQPALDDVQEGFYPFPETQDEDHLDTYSLGEVYASSGIRRRSEHGLVHEIDWALFEFHDSRQPDDNAIPWVLSTVPALVSQVCNPTSVAPTSSLPGLEVHCMARTSGLQTGVIMPALTSVKIYGRDSPSHTYQITGTETSPSNGDKRKRSLPMGIPGDSGAWIIDRYQGQLCGHVLAWSERKRVAYICPMDVLLKDIHETLEATDIRVPGGKAVVAAADHSSVDSRTAVRGWRLADDLDSDLAREQSRKSKLLTQKVAGADSYHDGFEVDGVDEMRKLHLSGKNLENSKSSRMPIR